MVVAHSNHQSQKAGSAQADAITPFRWQAPNSKAALFFGDKWLELHSFLTKRDAASHHALTSEHHQNRKKHISRQSPAWVEYFLDLMRVRGYYMHYPGLNAPKNSASAVQESLVIIHNELYTPPEEYTNEPLTAGGQAESPKSELPAEDEVLTIASEDTYLASHDQTASSQRILNSERPLFHSMVSLLEPF